MGQTKSHAPRQVTVQTDISYIQWLDSIVDLLFDFALPDGAALVAFKPQCQPSVTAFTLLCLT
jgi:hypothetical protein